MDTAHGCVPCAYFSAIAARRHLFGALGLGTAEAYALVSHVLSLVDR